MENGMNLFNTGDATRTWCAAAERLSGLADLRQTRDWNYGHLSERLDRLASSMSPQPKPFEPVRIKMRFNTDELVNIFKSIARQALGEDADLELLKSMMPREVFATKNSNNCTMIETVPIVERIKWREKMAARFGFTLDVFRDERTDANSKADDLAILQALSSRVAGSVCGSTSETGSGISDLKRGQVEIKEKIDGIQQDLSESLEVGRNTNAIAQAFMPPRPSDYACSIKNLEQILSRLDVTRSERQIRRWEDYILSSGANGTQPPSGYTLKTRLTVASATAWAETFATQEKARLRTRTYLNEMTSTHDSKPAKRT